MLTKFFPFVETRVFLVLKCVLRCWICFLSTTEIWDALRAAAEAELALAQAIVDSAGVIVQSADLTICYDERGIKSLLLFYFLYMCKSAHILTRTQIAFTSRMIMTDKI